MIQFKYDSIMKRYDILVPSSLAGIESMVTVGHIDEEVESNITVYRELTITLLRQILLHWDEYQHQMTRELQDMLDDDSDNKHESIWIPNDRLTYLVERLQLSSWKDIPIESCPESDYLRFSVRTLNVLWSANIRTVGELVEKSAIDLCKLKNCGRKSLTEIESSLQELGLTLKQTNDNRLKFH